MYMATRTQVEYTTHCLASSERIGVDPWRHKNAQLIAGGEEMCGGHALGSQWCSGATYTTNHILVTVEQIQRKNANIFRYLAEAR